MDLPGGDEVRQSGDNPERRRPQTQYLLALIASSRGDVDSSRALAESAVREAEQRGDMSFAGGCRTVLGRLELSLDDPAAAVRWLEPAVQLVTERGANEPFMCGRADLIEGFAQVGRLAESSALRVNYSRLVWRACSLDHNLYSICMAAP